MSAFIEKIARIDRMTINDHDRIAALERKVEELTARLEAAEKERTHFLSIDDFKKQLMFMFTNAV